MTPSNIPGPYDEARVAQLQPIRDAIDALGLPVIRKRKLLGILNALTMQIEDGGDSPVVNRRLIEALRAGVVHQVGKKNAKPVLARIRDFERSEARRARRS